MSRIASALLAALLSIAAATAQSLLIVDYPLDGSIFPPEITPPTFLWRDTSRAATRWIVEIAFASGVSTLRFDAAGERPTIGEIDLRCLSQTNEPPQLSAQMREAHAWTPAADIWAAIKKGSSAAPATITIRGFSGATPVSSGHIEITTSKHPVGAPIFYRDVPLMPSETEKGLIKPLAKEAVRLIQWRLRNVGEASSRVVLKDMPTCANCHSFSMDGKTMGMDLDGPQNDKGLYAIAAVRPQMSIRNQDMITWNPTQDRQTGLNRVGFMSQVSPDGEYVLTTVTSAATAPQNNFYVVNFKDYRFLQVFYPTRGILAWYSRATGRREPLPGADDPDYVQTDGVWSPDGKYIVFARAKAKDPYPADAKMAAYANDPAETAIQYDLYRIPFNAGHGGKPEPVAGASENGMSNTFPKVSPDGRWIVFVKCKNGQLMRPDSELYIVRAQGGEARRMRCNTSLMNSWHSFSPNGRWMVFSSKSRSPYTQMYLTHIDENGNDSPAILIDNATAANRAVNLPEFVNIPENGLLAIATPAVEMYQKFDRAVDLGDKGQFEAAAAEWRELAAMSPDDARIRNNLGAALARLGRFSEAIPEYEKALELNPQYHAIHNNLGRALAMAGRVDEAVTEFERAVASNPNWAEAENNLGRALASKGELEASIPHFTRAVELDAKSVEARFYLGASLYYGQGRVVDAMQRWREALALDPDYLPALNEAAHLLASCPDASARNGAESVKLAERAVELSHGSDPVFLDTLAAAYAESGRFQQAIETATRALEIARRENKTALMEGVAARLRMYQAGVPYRDGAPEQ